MTPAQSLLNGLQTRVRSTLQPAALDTFSSNRATLRNPGSSGGQAQGQAPAQPTGQGQSDILSAIALGSGLAGGAARTSYGSPGVPQGPIDPNYNPFGQPPGGNTQPPQPQIPAFRAVPYFNQGPRQEFLQAAYGTQPAGQGLSLQQLLEAVLAAGINPFQPAGTPTRANPLQTIAMLLGGRR